MVYGDLCWKFYAVKKFTYSSSTYSVSIRHLCLSSQNLAISLTCGFDLLLENISCRNKMDLFWTLAMSMMNVLFFPQFKTSI